MSSKRTIERAQTGVRIEKRVLKVLKALAAHHEIGLGDLIEGIVRLLYSDEHNPVNIGNPDEITILEFAETINEVTGNKGGITYVPTGRSARDPQRRRPDVSRAKSILDWEAKVNLRNGIEKTMPYFMEKLGL